MKRCWCGLFVHKNVTDPDSLSQIRYSVCNIKTFLVKIDGATIRVEID